MKIIPVILLLVFSCAVCAQELKEKYAEADGFRQKSVSYTHLGASKRYGDFYRYTVGLINTIAYTA